jgi:hypothetical protein
MAAAGATQPRRSRRRLDLTHRRDDVTSGYCDAKLRERAVAAAFQLRRAEFVDSG